MASSNLWYLSIVTDVQLNCGHFGDISLVLKNGGGRGKVRMTCVRAR